jgi:RNA polymerase sigma-70 factor (ECF subfamily)
MIRHNELQWCNQPSSRSSLTKQHTERTAPHTSFEALARPHLQTLFNLARRFTHDTALAQDLVQETLLRAYRFAHRFEPGTNFRAWLLTIMRNLYISQRRKQRRQTSLDSPKSPTPRKSYTAVEEPEVSQLTELTLALPYLVTDDVFHALRALSADNREAVLMADVLDYSYEDIATIMHCPVGTVMSRLHRGRQKLRERLQPYATAQGYLRPGLFACGAHALPGLAPAKAAGEPA